MLCFQGTAANRSSKPQQQPQQQTRSSKHAPVAWESHNADARMSPSLMAPRDVEYANVLQEMGWKVAAVITSVNSSMFSGLMSTKSAVTRREPTKSRKEHA